MFRADIYLNFPDKCEEAFKFYQSVFGGEIKAMMKFKDMPPVEAYPVKEEDKEKVVHIELPIGTNITLMGSDVPEHMGPVNQGNNYSIIIAPESEKETKDLFDKLSKGGKIIMPLEKTFWNAYYGMFEDKFGIRWMLNYFYVKPEN